MNHSAAVALVLATPVATWFLVGDLSATQFDDLDFLWRAPALPATVERVLGVVAALIALAAAGVLSVALLRREVRRQWSATVVPLCVAGALVAYAGRVVSAGGAGVDIGAAMMIFLAGPLVLVLIVAAAWNACYEGRRP